jgi:hypothetical protein
MSPTGIYGMLFPPSKTGPTIYDRLRTLFRANPRGILGRAAVTRELFGQHFSLADVKELNRALNDLIVTGRVREEKIQTPGTGQEGPPFFEYNYTLVRKP